MPNIQNMEIYSWKFCIYIYIGVVDIYILSTTPILIKHICFVAENCNEEKALVFFYIIKINIIIITFFHFLSFGAYLYTG